MSGYYDHILSAESLVRVYEIAPPRVQQYLQAEIDYVLSKIKPGDLVLDLGCGYGRVLAPLARKARTVVGIDTSPESLRFGLKTQSLSSNCHLLCMDAVWLAFASRIFDVVVCIQNGVSAFHVDQKDLVRESIRVAKPGGIVLFSSYSDKFWEERLQWFRLQSDEGLLGEVDSEKTSDGVIVCKDGFTATTVNAEKFRSLTMGLNADVAIVEIDESSLFCEIVPH